MYHGTVVLFANAAIDRLLFLFRRTVGNINIEDLRIKTFATKLEAPHSINIIVVHPSAVKRRSLQLF
jgi:hypothetical protein